MNRPRLVSLLFVLAARSLASADDPPTDATKAEAARATKAIEIAKAEAGFYRIELEGASRRVAVLQPDSLLQWSNPVAGSIHGSVFVWTDRGCPVALASIYKWFSPNTHIGVELHALSPDVASADRKGKRAWVPSRLALGRKPIPGAPTPADSPAGRLRQLRALAKEFTATETTRDDITRELRLLPRPLYRYQSTDPDVLDGALFAFVEGTDPEIVLSIEARATPEGPRWQYSAARFNSLTLRLAHKGKDAWSAPTITWAEARDHRRPYSLFMYGSDPGMVFDDSEQ